MQYPRANTEFEVQAEAFFRLRAAGYDVRAEVPLRRPGLRGARFDLVIFDVHKRPWLILEVKKSEYSRAKAQQLFYSQITGGVPCIYVRGMANAWRVVELVIEATVSDI